MEINICLKMLSVRGYNIIENDQENNTIFAQKEDDKLVVFFCTDDKFNIQSLKRYISQTKDLELEHCIIIYKDQITSSASKQIDNLDCEVELFCRKELQYDITKHRLVPQHSKVPDNLAMIIRKKDGHNLPQILKTDPVVRFYNFKKGDIIKISRHSEDGDYIIYRIVK
jgi:DNA-directed RNA polymerase I, II, and III subunit RPABC1